jgi:hypothetical protein
MKIRDYSKDSVAELTENLREGVELLNLDSEGSAVIDMLKGQVLLVNNKIIDELSKRVVSEKEAEELNPIMCEFIAWKIDNLFGGDSIADDVRKKFEKLKSDNDIDKKYSTEEMKKPKFSELEMASEGLMSYLSNKHPHHCAIVTSTGVEVFESQEGVQTDRFLKD